MGFYLKRVATKDTPADVAYRKAYAAVVEQVNAEMSVKYPVIDEANFFEAVRFKDDRLSELTKQIKY